MRYSLGILTVSALLISGVACNEGRYSSSGFHLPQNGDVERGKVAFVELGCNACHKVSGVELPGPAITPGIDVPLGGETGRRLSDAYLVTAMLNPDYHLAPHVKGVVTENGHSRMPAFTAKMTAQQMVDIVAFLQSHYVIRHFTPNNTFQ